MHLCWWTCDIIISVLGVRGVMQTKHCLDAEGAFYNSKSFGLELQKGINRSQCTVIIAVYDLPPDNQGTEHGWPSINGATFCTACMPFYKLNVQRTMQPQTRKILCFKLKTTVFSLSVGVYNISCTWLSLNIYSCP